MTNSIYGFITDSLFYVRKQFITVVKDAEVQSVCFAIFRFRSVGVNWTVKVSVSFSPNAFLNKR